MHIEATYTVLALTQMWVNNQRDNRYNAIGVMSGTSHDGLDLCFAEYSFTNQGCSYRIIKARTVEYDQSLRQSLMNAYNLSGRELSKLNAWYGVWIAKKINEFKLTINEPIDVIGSHGHTIFHDPKNGYSTQIGSGAHIAAEAGIDCICDFRSGDIARGGQGAPLVPIGDELLFPNYNICLNIGGIANLSYSTNGHRVAYDICPANMALNRLMQLHYSISYDKDGVLGRRGNIDESLLEKLNSLDYYHNKESKSLGREWFESTFQPLVDNHNANIEDKLRTLYEHIALKISESLTIKKSGTVLLTGGGAKNSFLTDLIDEKTNNTIIIPSDEVIDFKEALIFGFLAILYLRKTPTSLASVTGASANSIGGCLYYH